MLKALIALLVAVMLLGPALLFGGWITMLCLGALAHIFNAAPLAISYWPSVLVDFILFLMLGGSK